MFNTEFQKLYGDLGELKNAQLLKAQEKICEYTTNTEFVLIGVCAGVAIIAAIYALYALYKKRFSWIGRDESNYWINKWPHKDVPGKDKGGIVTDPRNYIYYPSHIATSIVKKNVLKKLTEEDTVNACLKWVYENVKYIKDYVQWGERDYWEPSDAALVKRLADCFTGDTEIIVRNKKSGVVSDKRLIELKHSWDEYEALSYDFENQKTVFKPIVNFLEQGESSVFKVSPRSGGAFKCTNNHQFYNRYTQSCKMKWEHLKNIKTDRYWTRQVASVLSIPEGVNEINDDLANLIGSYIADGWINNSHICISGDNKVRQDKLRNALDNLGIKYTDSKRDVHANINILKKGSPKELLDLLISCGNTGKEKYFPDMVMSADTTSVAKVLKYYSDRDGTHEKGILTVLSTVSNVSSKQLKILCTQLGIHNSSYIQIQDRKDCNRLPIHRIYIGANLKKTLPGCELNSFLDISFAGVEKVFDITVEDTHNFILSDSNVIAHNCDGKAIAFKALTLSCGIPDWKVKIACGYTDRRTGHAYCLYLKSNSWFKKGSWHTADPTWSGKLGVEHKKDNRYGELWYTFTKKHSYLQKRID